MKGMDDNPYKSPESPSKPAIIREWISEHQLLIILGAVALTWIPYILFVVWITGP